MNLLRFVMFVSVVSMLSLQAAFADRTPTSNNAAGDQVQSALKAEAAGSVSARDEKLREALTADPNSKEANWQSGKIERDGRWIDFKTLPDEWADESTLNEYRDKRDNAPLTVKSQVDLANWCKAHRLFERERHLIAAIELSPNGSDPAICARLGLRLVDGVWISDDEIRTEKREQAAARKNLKARQPVIQRLSDKLDSRGENARAQARLELEALADPAVLPALEAVLAEASLEKARLLVELLARFKTVKAAEPLARLAVGSEWSVVRKEAAAKLRERPVGSYAPELLASLRTPIDSKINLYVGSRGVHLSQQLTSETQSTVQHYERQFALFIEYVRGPAEPNLPNRQELMKNQRQRVIDRAQFLGSQEASAAEREVAEQNNEIENWNARVCTALADTTGVSLPAKPEPWWEWWRTYNQLSESSKNQEYEYSYTTDTTIVEAIPPTSCLVAGTPVWSDRGLVPIEMVNVGDLVLSKHPESGELTYQPVLRTTVRDPEPVLKVTTDQGEIRGTGGHNFWVSGRGWTMLRNVKPNDRFHGATQPATIRSVASDEKEKTYNLVVADFHTYFVGADLVLSHDVTFARPIDATVPGMKVE